MIIVRWSLPLCRISRGLNYILILISKDNKCLVTLESISYYNYFIARLNSILIKMLSNICFELPEISDVSDLIGLADLSRWSIIFRIVNIQLTPSSALNVTNFSQDSKKSKLECYTCGHYRQPDLVEKILFIGYENMLIRCFIIKLVFEQIWETHFGAHSFLFY